MVMGANLRIWSEAVGAAGQSMGMRGPHAPHGAQKTKKLETYKKNDQTNNKTRPLDRWNAGPFAGHQ